MAKIIFQDEQGQNLNRYKMTPVEGQADTYDLERAANITQQGTPYNKEVGDHFLQVEDGTPVQTLTCTKSGTVYALTGLTATSGKVPVMFSVPTAYASWDTVTIDGTAYTLKTRDNSALTAGAWAAGAIITGTVDVDAKTLTVMPSAPVGAVTVLPINALTAAQLDNASFPYSYETQISCDIATQIGLSNNFYYIKYFSPYSTGGYGAQEARILNGDAGDAVYHRNSNANINWSAWTRDCDGGHAASADTASGSVALASPGLRNIAVSQTAPSDTSALWMW